MKTILISFVAVFFSTLAWAQEAGSQASSDQQKEVLAYTQHLNTYFAGLNVRPVSNDPKIAPVVLKELSNLEGILHGDYVGSAGQLKNIACERCVCVGCYAQPPP